MLLNVGIWDRAIDLVLKLQRDQLLSGCLDFYFSTQCGFGLDIKVELKHLPTLLRTQDAPEGSAHKLLFEPRGRQFLKGIMLFVEEMKGIRAGRLATLIFQSYTLDESKRVSQQSDQREERDEDSRDINWLSVNGLLVKVGIYVVGGASRGKPDF